METNFDLSVKDWRGNVLGFRCIDCGGIYQQMWGNICNNCRDKERRHRELLNALRDIATTKSESTPGYGG